MNEKLESQIFITLEPARLRNSARSRPEEIETSFPELGKDATRAIVNGATRELVNDAILNRELGNDVNRNLEPVNEESPVLELESVEIRDRELARDANREAIKTRVNRVHVSIF